MTVQKGNKVLKIVEITAGYSNFHICGEVRKAQSTYMYIHMSVWVCGSVLHIACHASCAIINLDSNWSKESGGKCFLYWPTVSGIHRQDSGTAPAWKCFFFWPLAWGSDKNRILFALHVNTCKLKCLNHALTHWQTVKNALAMNAKNTDEAFRGEGYAEIS